MSKSAGTVLRLYKSKLSTLILELAKSDFDANLDVSMFAVPYKYVFVA